MESVTFYDPRQREVVIEISDNSISFYFGENIRRQEKWVEQQIENGHDVSDEEKKVETFYWIDKQNWIDDFTQRLDREDNFHKHMKEKKWFTVEMYEYLNKSCGLNKQKV